MNVTYKKITDLKPYKNNAKKHPKEQVERIAESIRQFGFTQPVLVDKNNIVVAGHGRILGARKAGLKEVPTVCMEDLTEEQIKAYRLIDNKLNESPWDFSLIDSEIKDIELIDMSLFGFEEEKKKSKEVKFSIDEKYEIHVICESERHMKDVYETLSRMGLECKLVSTL